MSRPPARAAPRRRSPPGRRRPGGARPLRRHGRPAALLHSGRMSRRVCWGNGAASESGRGDIGSRASEADPLSGLRPRSRNPGRHELRRLMRCVRLPSRRVAVPTEGLPPAGPRHGSGPVLACSRPCLRETGTQAARHGLCSGSIRQCLGVAVHRVRGRRGHGSLGSRGAWLLMLALGAGSAWNHPILWSDLVSSSGPAGGASDGYWLGRGDCRPGPPVYDYRGRGTPSHRLGRIHLYVRSCFATAHRYR